MSIRSLTLTTLASLCAMVGIFLVWGSVSQAAEVHEYLSRITEVPAQGPHGEEVPLSGKLLEQNGMTVDAGELYVSEHAGSNRFGNSDIRLDKFDASSGTFAAQLFHAEQEYKAGELLLGQGVAVAQSTGEVYAGAQKIVEMGNSNSESVVAVLGASGNLLADWTGADTPSRTFGNGGVRDVAVDNSAGLLGDWAAGDVYVVDNPEPEGTEAAVDVFEPKAGGGESYVAQLTGVEGVPFAPTAVAIDPSNGDVLVAAAEGGDREDQVVDVFEPVSAMKGSYKFLFEIADTPGGPLGNVGGLAVDGSNGQIYIDTEESAAGQQEAIVDQFSSAGAYLGRITAAEAPVGTFGRQGRVAVDPATHEIYVGGGTEEGGFLDVFGAGIVVPDVTTGAPSGLVPAGAKLNGSVNPDSAGEATCQFDWGTSHSFGKVAPCAETVEEGSSPAAVHAVLNELQPDTTYYYQLQATNLADGHTNPGEPWQEEQFTTPGPGIHEESVSNVASTSATLHATIDPHGVPTTDYFQYGASAAYGTEAPVAPGLPIGSGEGDVEVVGQHLQELAAGTVYHYRVVAVSELNPGVFEVFDGADQTFMTQPVGSGFALPDGRQWEMVSPVDKLGARLEPISEMGLAEAAASGDGMTYLATSPTEPETQGYTNAHMQLLSRRGPDGWVTQDIGLPHEQPTGVSVGNGFEYRFFSEDLSRALAQPFGPFDRTVSPEASEQTPFLRTSYLNESVDEPCLPAAMNCYRPLVTGAAGYANVPSGTVFGKTEASGKACGEPTLTCGPSFVDATPDLSHVLLASGVALAPEGEGEGGLYEWTAGKLTPIPGIGDVGQRHGFSNDGSRVISRGDGAKLVMRDIAKGETIRLDAIQGGTGEGAPQPLFQDASSEASRVFFTDSQRLTSDSVALEGKADLYECEMIEVEGKLHCVLSDLTPALAGELEPPDVQGGVLGASEDGSYVYFVADGALTQSAGHGTCEGEFSREGETCNLYVRHAGVTKLIAVLSGADEQDWHTTLGSQTARVSPNGQWLAFMSEQDLTGYVTRDAVSGKPDEEVYLYSVSSGHLVCASCDPTGARPVGVKYSSISDQLVGGDRVWNDEQWIAANVPGWTPYRLSASLYQSRYLSNSGRLFFNSSDALVPQDVDGTEDVYEYEPPGVGNCGTFSLTYSERSNGCVGLISSGTSAEESAFLDASENGGDVFFLTTAKLAPQDVDTTLDVYDAHECTSSSLCFPAAAVQPPPCTNGDACKPSPTPQPALYGAPSSETFSGAGNVASAPAPAVKPKAKAKSLTRTQKVARALRACDRKKQRKERSACERKARARYAAKKRSGKAKAKKRGRG